MSFFDNNKGYKRTYVPPLEHHLDNDMNAATTGTVNSSSGSSHSNLTNTNKIINDSGLMKNKEVLDYNIDATNLTVNSNNNNNSNNSSNCKDGRINIIGGSGCSSVGSLMVTSANIHKSGAKKPRRSSVLSLDLNDEDGRIELDDEQPRGGLTDASSSTANGAV